MAEKERFLKMKHWVFDAICQVDMTDAERKVMMCVVRYTVGFRRYEAKLSFGFIATYTNISKGHAARCVNSLERLGYISVIEKGTGKKPNMIRFNYKNFSVSFRQCSRLISADLASHSDSVSVSKLCDEEKKEEKKNIEKKNKEREFFSPQRVDDMTDDEWRRMNEEVDWGDDD